MTKSSQAFRTIREVAEWLGVAAHVLRFWESKFPQIKPVKRAGGRRYYRPSDMELIGGIKVLLHDRGLTIRGVQRMIREGGIAAVTALSPPLDLAASADADVDGDDAGTVWAHDGAQDHGTTHAPSTAKAAPADTAPQTAIAAANASFHHGLAQLAAIAANPTALSPSPRRALIDALTALHAKMRAKAPA